MGAAAWRLKTSKVMDPDEAKWTSRARKSSSKTEVALRCWVTLRGNKRSESQLCSGHQAKRKKNKVNIIQPNKIITSSRKCKKQNSRKLCFISTWSVLPSLSQVLFTWSTPISELAPRISPASLYSASRLVICCSVWWISWRFLILILRIVQC